MKWAAFKIVDRAMRYARKKSPWILHLDTGGCLPADAELITKNGEFIKMGDLVDTYVPFNPAKGIQSAIIDERVLSTNSPNPGMKRASLAHRVKAPLRLVEIETSTGNVMRLTGNHPVLVDTKNGMEWIESERVSKGNFLYSPREIIIDETLPLLVDCLPENLSARIPKELRLGIKRRLDKDLKKAADELGVSYQRLASNAKPLKIRELKSISEHLDIEWNDVAKEIYEVSYKGVIHKIRNKYPDENLLYLLGLIASDGYISVNRNNGHANYKVSFSNKEKTLVDEFIKCVKSWFPDKKICLEKNPKTEGLHTVYLYSPIFVHLADSFGLKGLRKAENFRPIFRLPKELITAFLSGYFDGDGDVSITTEPGRKTARLCISYTTINKDAAHVLNLLLKRIGIASRTDKTMNRSTFGERMLYRVRITNNYDVSRFIERIKPVHPMKISRLSEAHKELLMKQKKQSTIDLAPLSCLELIRKLQKKYNLTNRDITGSMDASNIYKMNRRRATKHTIRGYISNVRKAVKHDEGLDKLEELVSDSFFINPVKRVSVVPNKDEWVYNVTVDETHSYIPDGNFVVKNCNGCAIEMFAMPSPRYDIERFGALSVGNPRHTDILLVSGAISRKMRPRLKRIYEQIPDPKAVVAVGSCAITKGVFHDAYNIDGPLDKVMPVDVFVPGCPPKPEAIIKGLLDAVDIWHKRYIV